MNRLVFQQVEELFHEAVACDPPTRRVLLDRIAREHSPEVSDMVRRLLSQDLSDARWTDLGLSSGADRVPPELEPEGRLIGRFRIVRRLGYGGHGDVYLAEQVEPVRRTVALKMVRTGGASEAAIARFRSEQQALALMSHPNIAAVYEAGLAERGRMYFAMAYVEGEPIDAFCDRRRLTVRERLTLFLKVCGAVQHAHQKGLIHRDLKPSNILVTERDGEAEPVLIDFGIAMATAPAGETGAGDGEHARVALGTPAFMSPEQAGPAPQDLDTRSDVFALGILLYELLAGCTPLDVLSAPDASLAEIRRCIVEEPVPAPSAVLERDDDRVASAAERRRCTPASLRRQVRGDLDAIVTKAAAHRREDRYQTAEALAADVENALAHRPVTARSAGPAARARRFARRHRVSVAVGAIVLAALLVGVIGTSAGMLRAHRAARESDAVNSFLQDVLTSSQALEKGSTVRFVDVLASGADMAEERLADYPRRAGEVHYVLGNTYVNLGLYRDARAELDRSLQLLRDSTGMDSPLTQRTANTLASLLAVLLELDEARALVDEVAAHSAGRGGPWREPYLTSQRVLCDILIRRGDTGVARQKLREVIAQIDAELGPHHTEAYNARISLSTAMARGALGLGPEELRELQEARVALMEETVRLQRERFGGDDAIPLLGSELVLGRSYLELRRYDDAAALLEPLLPRIEARVGRQHGVYIEAATALAGLRYARGDYAAAADLQLASLEASRARLAPGHPNLLGNLRDTLPFLDAADRVDEGLALARELYGIVEPMLGPDSGITRDARGWVARFCDRAGLLEEADDHFAALLATTDEDSLHMGSGGYVQLFHAGHLARGGRFEEAEAVLLSLADRVGGVTVGLSNVAHRDDIARMFVEVYEAWGRPDKVREYEDLIATMRSE